MRRTCGLQYARFKALSTGQHRIQREHKIQNISTDIGLSVWVSVTDKSDVEHDIRGAATCLGGDSQRRANNRSNTTSMWERYVPAVCTNSVYTSFWRLVAPTMLLPRGVWPDRRRRTDRLYRHHVSLALNARSLPCLPCCLPHLC